MSSQGPPSSVSPMLVGQVLGTVRPPVDLDDDDGLSDASSVSLEAPTLQFSSGLTLDFTDVTPEDGERGAPGTSTNGTATSVASEPQESKEESQPPPQESQPQESRESKDQPQESQPQESQPRDRSRSRSRPLVSPHIFDSKENATMYRSIAFEQDAYPTLPNLVAADTMDCIFKSWPEWREALMLVGVPDVSDTSSPMKCVETLFDTVATAQWVDTVTAQMYKAFPYYREANWTLPSILLWEVVCNFHIRQSHRR
ncbi:unnamed protein product [Prorocentrum cordatum]|uniref:Uncharacterized protein n=1 Tax=Prorocentrum cordatum TaxID=2364126 RepID=A0ABN9PQ99_9DINO|nr:unnamed protein product [Polarella glacialis]